MSNRLDAPEVMTRDEVAAVFGVHPSTVTRWMQRGLLRRLRIPSGQHRYRREDIEQFLNTHPTVRPTT